MKGEEFVFLLVFVVSLGGLVYLLGASITGYVVQSMHCEAGACKELCDSNVGCSDGVCCDFGSYGVCEDSILCEREYEFMPKVDMNIRIGPNMPIVESPAPVQKNNIVAFSAIILLVLAIGIIYFIKIRKHP